MELAILGLILECITEINKNEKITSNNILKRLLHRHKLGTYSFYSDSYKIVRKIISGKL